MRYKLIGSNNLDDIIATTLKNRQIDDVNTYLNLNSVDDEEYKGLSNINEAVECFASHIERGSDVGILFDTDT